MEKDKKAITKKKEAGDTTTKTTSGDEYPLSQPSSSSYPHLNPVITSFSLPPSPPSSSSLCPFSSDQPSVVQITQYQCNDSAPVRTDMSVECKDCENIFMFTVSEQMWFYDRDLDPPKRCHDCRAKRKGMILSSSSSSSSSPFSPMQPAITTPSCSSSPSFLARDDLNDRRRHTFSITCDKCGQTEIVPFAPNPHRAVYCKSCYSSMPMTNCSNCGIKCRVTFKPKADKPIYCRSCYIDLKTSKK